MKKDFISTQLKKDFKYLSGEVPTLHFISKVLHLSHFEGTSTRLQVPLKWDMTLQQQVRRFPHSPRYEFQVDSRT